MKHPLLANAAQARQTKQVFARPEDQLSYELGKAVKELPPLYTRLLAGTICFVVFGAIAWAGFSEIDEVAVAQGELIASTQVRPVTSLGNGEIVAINVEEGDRVTKDQILIQRNPELKQTDVTRLAKSTTLIQEDLQRLQAERIGGQATTTEIQDELLKSRLRDYQARQAAAEAEANRQKALIDQARVRLTRLQDNLTSARTSVVNAKTNLANAENIRVKVESNLEIAQSREENLRILITPGAVPRVDYLEAKERLTRTQTDITRARDEVTNAQNRLTEAQDKVTSLQKDIAAQVQEIRQAQAAYQAAWSQAQRVASERKSEILTQINKRQEELTNVSGQLEQARQEKDGETIKAPVAGTIYKIKATKGPVQAGEELLSILPEGEEIQLEVKVLNRDIGFIQKGMKTKVKMATFPFQEFGTIDGEVVQVSPNASVDKELGLVFPTRIKLKKHALTVRGQEVAFTPGMAATGEIVTRKKSILTFILEPVTRRFSEAFSVR
ncbi:MAG TPA: HlyD family efflux transporter periplasmic adaptor subunit [Trichormus sp. M33_DOE_039]|nr:HlyD family efflux transporter periplasmic adaptor subunit [Trichormus sp. M33_DOE_039]